MARRRSAHARLAPGAERGAMTTPLDHVAAIAAWLAATDIDELELTGPDGHLRLRRSTEPEATTRRSPAAPPVLDSSPPAAEIIVSPGMGVFLHAHPLSETPLASARRPRGSGTAARSPADRSRAAARAVASRWHPRARRRAGWRARRLRRRCSSNSNRPEEPHEDRPQRRPRRRLRALARWATTRRCSMSCPPPTSPAASTPATRSSWSGRSGRRSRAASMSGRMWAFPTARASAAASMQIDADELAAMVDLPARRAGRHRPGRWAAA